jgi:hypothetical protein
VPQTRIAHRWCICYAWFGVTCTAARCSRGCGADRDAAGDVAVALPLSPIAACIRTGRWLSCFGKRAKSRKAQILEKMKVLDDIVSDSGVWQLMGTARNSLCGQQQPIYLLAYLFARGAAL